MRERIFYVYIMASRSRTLYIGFTSNLQVRVWQHKNGTFGGFTTDYRCERLVYLERYATAATAIAREKQLKRWSRQKKLDLLQRVNPAWADLSEDWGKPVAPFQEPVNHPGQTTGYKSGPNASMPAGLSTPPQSGSGRDDGSGK